MSDVEITRSGSAVLVQREVADGMGREHLWFDETTEGRLVFCAHVGYCGDMRIYNDLDDAEVPEEVREALDGPIYDLEGFQL